MFKKTITKAVFILVLISPTSYSAIIVDSFFYDYMRIVSSVDSQQVFDNDNILGGWRAGHIGLISGQHGIEGPYSGHSIFQSGVFDPVATPDAARWFNNAGMLTETVLSWNGLNGPAPESGDPIELGLGGLDLTENGRNNGFVIAIDSFVGDSPAFLTIRVYDDDQSFSGYTKAIASKGNHYFDFSNFNLIGLTSVDAIQLIISAENSTQHTGFVINDFYADLTPVPAPATVWLFSCGLIGLIFIARRVNVWTSIPT